MDDRIEGNGQRKLDLRYIVYPAMFAAVVLSLASLVPGLEPRASIIAELLGFVAAIVAGAGGSYALRTLTNGKGKDNGRS